MAKLWFSIYEEQKKKIMDGDFNKGDKFHTAKDLADEFDISMTTSRRVLDELAKDGLIVGVPRVGAVIKRNLVPRKAYLVIPESNEAFSRNSNSSIISAEIMIAISKEAAAADVELNVVSENFLKEVDKEEHNYILIPFDPLLGNIEEFVQSSNSTAVLISPPRFVKGAYCVRSDLQKGAYIATKHLIEKGHTKIAHLMVSSPQWQESRFEGYMEALKDSGIPLSLGLVREIESSKAAVHAAMRDLMSMPEPPTALFCFSDIWALHAIEYCRGNKIAIPDDLAICGLDNRHESQKSKPALTTVDTFWCQNGEKAIQLLVQLMDGDDKVKEDNLLDPELIVRK
ncbi:MAG: LacI family DNA-binding transcriptional regulator, partial [Planctomycetota bacterium]